MRAVTYLLYLIFWGFLNLGGCAYLVGWRGWSPWWFVLGVILAALGFQPKTWAKLFE